MVLTSSFGELMKDQMLQYIKYQEGVYFASMEKLL